MSNAIFNMHDVTDEIFDCACLWAADDDGDQETPDHWDEARRMIAAAPELLAALEEIKTLAEAGVIEVRETGQPCWTLTGAVSKIARAAIAKATA